MNANLLTPADAVASCLPRYVVLPAGTEETGAVLRIAYAHSATNLNVDDLQRSRRHEIEWMYEIDVEPTLAGADLQILDAVQESGRVGERRIP